ncbi:hypothetical protein EYF80_006681 [Liparis tanakae]|uniref:Uncharacterized protein n=1 Tax=Liparis tanakae TaxID=230148 RepID=A0A4Z2IZS3_9TELE|nr:hypothetical protein EYF80_006681 [Liparis tanakae]
MSLLRLRPSDICSVRVLSSTSCRVNSSLMVNLEENANLHDVLYSIFSLNNHHRVLPEAWRHISLCSPHLPPVPLIRTLSCLVFEGHRRVDLPRVHAGHPAAWVGQDRALRLPVVVARGHVATRCPTVHPVLVGGRVRARRDVTGQRRGGLQARHADQARIPRMLLTVCAEGQALDMLICPAVIGTPGLPILVPVGDMLG